jgi:hypothetical protein
MVAEALGAASAAFQTSTTLTATTNLSTTLTLDGLLYQLAVFKQDMEENPPVVAMRAEPGTLALIENETRRLDLAANHVQGYFGSIFGVRLEEDATIPPFEVRCLDHKGRIVERIEILPCPT